MTTQQTERGLPVAEHVGREIHMRLWERKITQDAAGAAIGIQASTLGKKLRGRVPITLDELYRLAELVGASPADLLPRLDSNQQPSGYQTPAEPMRDLSPHERRARFELVRDAS